MEQPYYVFYVPGAFHPLCEAIKKDGEWYTPMFLKNQAMMEQEYPGIVVLSYEDMQKCVNEAAKTEPHEINEEDFEEALGCLPPLDLTGSSDSRSFKMCEFYVEKITTIYVYLKQDEVYRYFSFRDLYSLKHSEIVDKVRHSAAYLQPS